jgi:hypothetical protein
MKTRNRHTATTACDLPVQLQDQLLGQLIAQHEVLDEDFTVWYPYPSSFAWLVAAQRVSKHWQEFLQQHPSFLRRSRLQALVRIGLLHDYAYLIRTDTKSRQSRRKKLPKQFELVFAEQQTVTCTTGRPGPSMRPDLPQDCLVITAAAQSLSPALLLAMLLEQAYLDQQRQAAYVLHIICHPEADYSTQKLPVKQARHLKQLLAAADLGSTQCFGDEDDSSSSSSSSAADQVQATLLAAQQQAKAAAQQQQQAQRAGQRPACLAATTSSTAAAAAGGFAAVPDLAALLQTVMEVRPDGVYFIPTSEQFRMAQKHTSAAAAEAP